MKQEITQSNQESTHGLYLLFDKIAEIHGPTFEAVNDAVAIRNIRNMTNLTTPEDFILKRVAYRTGTVVLADIQEIDFMNALVTKEDN